MNNLTISQINHFAFVSYSSDNHLVFYNVNQNKYIILEHSNNVLYSWKEHFADLAKNVYRIELEELFEINHKETNKREIDCKNDIKIKQLETLLKLPINILKTTDLLDLGKIKHIRKLKKNILKVSGDHLIDNFGDVIMSNGEVLTGTLCSAVDFHSTGKYIIIADKYKKIRILHPDGKIVKFIFISEQIRSISCNDKHLYVLTKENLEKYEIDTGKLIKKTVIEGCTEQDSLLVVGQDVFIVRDCKLLDLSLNVLYTDGKYLSYDGKLTRINIE